MQLHYQWQSDDPKTHYFQITLTVSEFSASDQQLLWLPVWTPGSYLIREFSRHIHHVHGTLALKNGQFLPFPIEKTSKNQWSFTPPVMGQTSTLIINYQVYAFDPSVRTAYFTEDSLALDGAAVWLSLKGTEHLPRTLNWVPPAAISPSKVSTALPWTFTTALEAIDVNAQGFGRYQASHYLEQIDTPILAGTCLHQCHLKVADTPHTLVFDDALTQTPALDLEQIQRDAQKVFEWNLEFWLQPLPFDRYFALIQIYAEQYGGLEHANSTRLVCSRYDLPRHAMTTDQDAYSSFLGLLSHEYFHSWWVKRLRPATLSSYTLEQEQYTSLLWMFEGFTAYFDDLSLVQSGLITYQRYLTGLEKLLDRVLHTPARHMHSLEEASFDAWIRSYRPDENTPNSTVSYYDQGSVLALVIDLTLIQHKSSLQQVLRHLWQTHAIPATQHIAGITEKDLIISLSQHAPNVDWEEFIKKYVHTPALADYEQALKAAAIDIEWYKTMSTNTMAQRLGVRFKENSLIVSHVLHGRSAALAGVYVGDEWLALDDTQLKISNWAHVFNRWNPEKYPSLQLSFFREGRLKSLPINYPTPLYYHSLRLNHSADSTQQANFQQWLRIGNGLS